jgi:hypothetical protein
MPNARKSSQVSPEARKPPSAKKSALGDVADILAASPAPPVSPVRSGGGGAPVASSKAVTQRVAERDGKAQSIYLRELDIDRANDIEHAVRKAKRVGGRVGLSLIVRAGLRLLAQEFEKDRERGVDLVAAVVEDEQG